MSFDYQLYRKQLSCLLQRIPSKDSSELLRELCERINPLVSEAILQGATTHLKRHSYVEAETLVLEGLKIDGLSDEMLARLHAKLAASYIGQRKFGEAHSEALRGLGVCPKSSSVRCSLESLIGLVSPHSLTRQKKTW